MGTNYYLYEKPDCECCGRPYEPLHIGKSSAGWCFLLHVIPERGLNTLEDWKKLWNKRGARIKDEYTAELLPAEMEDRIVNRSWEGPLDHRSRFWFAQNEAEPGPNNLVRCRVDGRHCIGHGPGTWDYITGEFS